MEFLKFELCEKYGIHPDGWDDPNYLSLNAKAAMLAKYQLEVEKQKKDDEEHNKKMNQQSKGSSNRGRVHPASRRNL